MSRATYQDHNGNDVYEAHEGAALYATVRAHAAAEGYTCEPFRTCYAEAVMTERGWTRDALGHWCRD